jgi:hypothetical protein
MCTVKKKYIQPLELGRNVIAADVSQHNLLKTNLLKMLVRNGVEKRVWTWQISSSRAETKGERPRKGLGRFGRLHSGVRQGWSSLTVKYNKGLLIILASM